jgi:Predicted integral membrane protein (DUF2269)
MSAYTLALFVHVIGALGMFAGFGTWFIGLIALRRAERVEQVRTITTLLPLAHSVGAGSVVLVIIPGVYMALTLWGLQTSWVVVSIVGVLMAAPIGPTLIEPRVETLGAMARETPDGTLSPALAARTHDPVLGTAMHTVSLLVVGIIFLMTIKPPLLASIITMAGALALGLLSSLPFWLAARARKRALVAPAQKL